MIEVEVRARLAEPEKAAQRLRELKAEHKASLAQSDSIYGFVKPGEPIGEGGIAVRIREEKEKASLEFKEIIREGGGFDVSVPVNARVAERLISKLGLNFLGRINKKRELFGLEGIEIALDYVDGLGQFIEVEKHVDSDEEAGRAREECIRLLNAIAPEAEIENRKYGDILLGKGNINPDL